MKKSIVMLVLFFFAGCAVAYFMFFTGDSSQRAKKIKYQYTDNNFVVTYMEYGVKREWVVCDSKVTSEAGKGYYMFFAPLLVQVPLDALVEELAEGDERLKECENR